MEFKHLKFILFSAFEENGFLRWADQALKEQCPAQLRRLANRAINTAPDDKKQELRKKIFPLI